MPEAQTSTPPSGAVPAWGGTVPWLLLALLVVLADQLSKWVVRTQLEIGGEVVVTSFFNLVHVYNRGAAFSFLAQAGGWQHYFFVALALVIGGWILVTLRGNLQHRWLCLALMGILGGAFGNVIDRLAYGAVVDFLDFHALGWHWPAFNVADSAIVLGAILFAWEQIRASKAQASL